MATATVLEIVTTDSPRAAVLRRRAKPVGRVTRQIQHLIEQMFATMRAARGLGLAAPQVGESVRVLVAQVEDRTVALVDPEILSADGEETATEACLSIPGVLGDVPRAAVITVRGRNRRGRRVTIHADGLLARVLQHEIDHLDGILFLDRVRDRSTIRVITPEEADAVPSAE
ncbi:MAG: peptide deformylase [Armatimonadota bacterium]|nr:peptide deformylase [Armatimonadota bacterium]MDR7519020.1 peptide deformylase [Armatimonadota bacterium]MDR7549201.1 peptide deformylase [Armatimonadota bacterium]